MKQTNVIAEKSKAFALRIIRLARYLNGEKHETVLCRQILRSGTSIGANIREASRGQSRADFYTKLTAYWLELLHESEYIPTKAYDSLYADCQELIRLLTAITRTIRKDL